MDKPGVQIERVCELQRSDPTLIDIITYLESSRLSNTSAEARAIMHSIDDCYLDPDGLLCHLWVPKGRRVPGIKSQLVVPTSSRHEILLSDRGSNFLSQLVKEVCFLMNAKKVFTTSYHPQCDGLVERFNGTLAQSLSMYVSSSQKDWDRYLNPVLFGCRISPSEVTGESTFFLLYGLQPRLPMDVSTLPPRVFSASIARTSSASGGEYRDCTSHCQREYPASPTADERLP